MFDTILNVIPVIARDSYRARQLLRLTCRRYYNMLGSICGIVNINEVCHCCDESRFRCIKSIIRLIECPTTRIYTIFIEGHCLHFARDDRPGGFRILIMIGSRYVVLCYHSAPTQSNDDEYVSHNIVICGQNYRLLSRDNGTELMRDHVPEIYRMMKFRATIHDLYSETIRIIASDSYRAHQLLRLTCKTYHDKLGEYNVLRPFTGPKGRILTTRRDFFDLMFAMIDDSSDFVECCIRVINGRLIRTVSYVPSIVGENMTIGNRTIVMFIDDKFNTICQIAKSFALAEEATDGSLRRYEIQIGDITKNFAIYEGKKYQGRAKQYICDYMPELYRVIKWSTPKPLPRQQFLFREGYWKKVLPQQIRDCMLKSHQHYN